MNEFLNLILPFLFYCCNIFVLTKKFVKLELKKHLVPDRLLPYFSSFPPYSDECDNKSNLFGVCRKNK